jgi:Leucine-rich repeat (LRR) protein
MKVPKFHGQPTDNSSLFHQNVFNFFGSTKTFKNYSTELNLIITCGITKNTKYLNRTITCEDINVQQITKLQPIFAVNSEFNTSVMTYVELYSEVMHYLPREISKFFPQLSTLKAQGGIKNILQINFKNLRELEEIIMNDNHIEYIDDDNIFMDNPKLNFINFEGNKIKKISENLLINLKKLGRFNLLGNECSVQYFHKIDSKSKYDSSKVVVDSICGAKLPSNFSYDEI